MVYFHNLRQNHLLSVYCCEQALTAYAEAPNWESKQGCRTPTYQGGGSVNSVSGFSRVFISGIE